MKRGLSLNTGNQGLKTMAKLNKLLIITLTAASATNAHAEDCQNEARAAMLDISHPVPMRQDVTTEMSGQKIISAALSTPDRRGMALDANENPVSLWDGGKFYTSSDAGKSWSLLSEQSQEDLAKQDENRNLQAEQATNITCDYEVELNGKAVHRYYLEYSMIPAGIPVQSTYWVDAETRFPWKIVHVFGGNNPSTITQLNTPQPGLEIPIPTN